MPLVDVFGQQNNHTGNSIITAHTMILTVETATNLTLGALIQNVVIQYSQPINVIREIGSKNFYYFAQPPRGSVQFGRIVAEDKIIFDVLPRDAKTVWNTPAPGQQNPKISLKSTASSGNSIQYDLYQCLVDNLGVTIDSQSSFIQENVSLTFGSLQIKSGNI